MRYDKMSPFMVMDIVAEAAKYDDAIHFEIGQPDLPPPPGVKRALADAVQRGGFSYTDSMGIAPLREKIAEHYRRSYALEIETRRILLTPGSSIAFMVAYQLTTEAGYSIAMGDPSYPCYRNFAYMVDCEALQIPLGVENGYCIEASALEEYDADVVHISSPSNPTGTLYPPEKLRSLCAECERRGISLISDELYHGLVYEGRAHSALEYFDDALVINGFSKYFCMPGLRLGWIIVPEKLCRAAEIIAQNHYISAPTPSQYAALEAFDYEYLDSVREVYAKRRDYLLQRLSKLFDISVSPMGAFYIWCDTGRYSDDSRSFAKELLENIHIAVTPGVDFGENGTKTHLRFSFTGDIEDMREGMDRLEEYLARR